MKILDIFSKLFSRKTRKTHQIKPQLLLGDSEKSTTMKKFDIVIFSPDEDGEHQRTENGVYGQSAQQLMALYAQTGERIQILREYGDLPTEKKPPIQEVPQNVKSIPQQIPQQALQQNIQPQSQPQQPEYVQVKKKSPPKYFSICGTDCKFEDDKIYQKQWVKILGNEATQYRLISDSNNKEVSLNGKHLEMLKWVLVQDETSNSENSLNSSIMQILKG